MLQTGGAPLNVPATYMRGGTSKGVFFSRTDLPKAAQVSGAFRDQLLLRVIGSPDPYDKHTDGMGGATSSTSKAVIVDKSSRAGHDVDYWFGQVAIQQPVIDWSGNCGNLTAAVGAFAIHKGLVDADRVPDSGVCTVRVWQANIQKTILVHVPISGHAVQEAGYFELDGVTFPSAEIPVEFMSPSQSEDALFPTGHLIEGLDVPGEGILQATLINAGIPTVFLRAKDLGYTGSEQQSEINSDETALQRLENIRTYAALAMGLVNSLEEARSRQHTPKLAFVAPPASYQASSEKIIDVSDIDLLVRSLSMGKLHHAMMGTAAIATACAAAVPGTLVSEALGTDTLTTLRIGHPSGTLTIGAEVQRNGNHWHVVKAVMSRSARVLMEGKVRVPGVGYQ